jgi:hypothetical protein
MEIMRWIQKPMVSPIIQILSPEKHKIQGRLGTKKLDISLHCTFKELRA